MTSLWVGLGWTVVGGGLLALAAFSFRYAWWRPAVDWRLPRVLMYHMVREHIAGARFNGLRVTPGAFEAQLRWLKAQGFQFFTVSELVDLGAGAPQKAVAISFDDGYADNLHHALPLLKQYGAKATIYLVCDRHDRDWSTYKKAHHNSGELAREPKLSDDEVRDLLASGCIEIGSHTLTHCNLARCDASQRHQEIAESKRQLENLFGVPVRSFCYPFGIYGEADVQAARDAGYANATTTRDGIDADFSRPLELKRIKVSGKDSPFAFRLRMRGGKRGWRK